MREYLDDAERLRRSPSLVERNLLFVVHMARGYRGRGIDFDDLIQEGNLGLMAAAGKFVGDLGTKFTTYAGHWIRRGFQRAIFQNRTAVKVPLYLHTTTRGGMGPARNPALPRPREAAAAAWKTSRLGRLADRHLPDRSLAVDPVYLAEQASLRDFVAAGLSRLPAKFAQVLRMRYGIGQEAMTLEECSKVLGITRQAVAQREVRALNLLKELWGKKTGR